jgi:hypothetical protein
MPQDEAKDVNDESVAESQATALVTSTAELATGFTLGKALHDAATQLATLLEAQFACADVTVADATLTVTYGAKPGNCTYRGWVFRGKHVIKVTKNDGDVVVEHEWQDVTNGYIRLNGSAHVTWTGTDTTRHVVHDVTWTRLADGRTGKETGDRTQRPLAGGIAEGVQIDGGRSWTGPSGRWDLQATGVEARWVDTVPQVGTYHLATPKGRSLTLTFRRVDDVTIEVRISGASRDYRFDVKR